MYPRNSASPLRIAIGAVILIADGTPQSGVNISITPQGGSESAGGGTIAYGSSGIVYYTPTQAETNYTAFVVTAYKTGCIPVAQTVITSASAVAGYAGIDWTAMLAALGTGGSLDGQLAAIAGYIDTEIADIQSRLPAALVGGKMDSNATATVDNDAIATAVWSKTISALAAYAKGTVGRRIAKWLNLDV